jgi:hypothetical protein
MSSPSKCKDAVISMERRLERISWKSSVVVVPV